MRPGVADGEGYQLGGLRDVHSRVVKPMPAEVFAGDASRKPPPVTFLCSSGVSRNRAPRVAA
jgi:hypothetical protein